MALAALVTAAAHAQALRGAPKLVVTDFTLQRSALGQFPDAPSDYSHNSLAQGYWTAVLGPEVRIGYRLSRGVLMDVGVAALYMDVPQTVPDSAHAREDQRVVLPPGPAFNGGATVFFPVTLGLHYDF